MTFQELRPHTDAGCRNRHNSGKVNCLKVKQAGELMLRPDEVLKVLLELTQVYFVLYKTLLFIKHSHKVCPNSHTCTLLYAIFSINRVSNKKIKCEILDS